MAITWLQSHSSYGEYVKNAINPADVICDKDIYFYLHDPEEIVFVEKKRNDLTVLMNRPNEPLKTKCAKYAKKYRSKKDGVYIYDMKKEELLLESIGKPSTLRGSVKFNLVKEPSFSSFFRKPEKNAYTNLFIVKDMFGFPKFAKGQTRNIALFCIMSNRAKYLMSDEDNNINTNAGITFLTEYISKHRDLDLPTQVDVVSAVRLIRGDRTYKSFECIENVESYFELVMEDLQDSKSVLDKEIIVVPEKAISTDESIDISAIIETGMFPVLDDKNNLEVINMDLCLEDCGVRFAYIYLDKLYVVLTRKEKEEEAKIAFPDDSDIIYDTGEHYKTFFNKEQIVH